MNAKPEIAAIVASHSRPGPLARVLPSILRQRDVTLEVVVVDNPSAKSDEVAAVVAGFPGVQLVRLPENVGFGRAINRGVAQTNAPLLYFACDDVELGDGCLHELAEAHRACKGGGLTAPVIYEASQPDKVRCAGGAYAIGWTVQLNLFRALPRPSSTSPYAVTFVPGGAVLTSRDLFTKLGGYRDDFFMYEEDTELSQRVRRAGFQIQVVPRAQVYDLVPPATYDPKVVRPEQIRNHLATVLLHAPLALVPLLFTRKLVGEVRRLPWRSVEDRRHWAAGWGRFLASVPRLLRDRVHNARVRRSLATGHP